MNQKEDNQMKNENISSNIQEELKSGPEIEESHHNLYHIIIVGIISFLILGIVVCFCNRRITQRVIWCAKVIMYGRRPHILWIPGCPAPEPPVGDLDGLTD